MFYSLRARYKTLLIPSYNYYRQPLITIFHKDLGYANDLPFGPFDILLLRSEKNFHWLLSVIFLIGLLACAQGQDVDDQSKASALEARIAELQTLLREEHRVRIDTQLMLLKRINAELLGQGPGSDDFQLAKKLATGLVVDMPRDPDVWRTLAHTKALEGITLSAAETLLGSHTDSDVMNPFTGQSANRPAKRYSWYHKDSPRPHVILSIAATVTEGKLVNWKVENR